MLSTVSLIALDMSRYIDGFPSIDDLVDQINKDIARRSKELSDDLHANILIENKIVSERFSRIHGLKSHLNHANQMKSMYNSQIVLNPHGHGTTSRGKLHRSYQMK